MKSLDHESLEEQTRLVPRYVAGDLSRSERAEFEAWLIASPELAAEVEMERRLRRGIASAARRGWLKRGATPATIGRDRRWRVALAASLVLALTTLGLSLGLPHPGNNPASATTEPREPRQRSASRTVRLASVRGVATLPDIAFTQADAPAKLVLEPDVVVLTCEDGSMALECPGGAVPYTPQYPEYELALVKHGDSSLAWRSERQAPVSRNQLSFELRDPGALEVGDYDLIVRGHSPEHEEVVARYLLRVAAQ